MIFEFRYWSGLWNQKRLIKNIQQGEMWGFRKRVWIIGLFAVVLFAWQAFWGLKTQNITPLYVTKGTEVYVLARLVSFIGALFSACIYVWFHLIFISYLFSKLTNIEYKKWKVYSFLLWAYYSLKNF